MLSKNSKHNKENDVPDFMNIKSIQSDVTGRSLKLLLHFAEAQLGWILDGIDRSDVNIGIGISECEDYEGYWISPTCHVSIVLSEDPDRKDDVRGIYIALDD